jgi:hypothetical protein
MLENVLFKHLILPNTAAGSLVSGWTFLTSIASLESGFPFGVGHRSWADNLHI